MISSENSKVEIEKVICNLCGSNSYSVLMSKKESGKNRIIDLFKRDRNHFNLVKCKNCSLVYLNPRPEEDSIKYYYDDNYYDRYDEKISDEKYKSLLKYTNKANLKGLNILDVGCANGLFLKKVRDIQAFPFGIEISEIAVKFAKDHFGLDNIFCGHIQDSPFDENKFDIITLWSVLEHLHNPKSSLKKVFSLLNEKGNVVILIPNFNSLPARIMHKNIDVPRHLYHFTPKTINMLLSDVGFKNIKIEYNNTICDGSFKEILIRPLRLLGINNISDFIKITDEIIAEIISFIIEKTMGVSKANGVIILRAEK